MKVGDGLVMIDGVLGAIRTYRQGTFAGSDDLTLISNTWYKADEFIPAGYNYAIVTITTWQSQNLQVRVGQNVASAQFKTWQHIIDMWDNNNGDGRASGVILLKRGLQFLIETNSSERDTDNVSLGHHRYSALFL